MTPCPTPRAPTTGRKPRHRRGEGASSGLTQGLTPGLPSGLARWRIAGLWCDCCRRNAGEIFSRFVALRACEESTNLTHTGIRQIRADFLHLPRARLPIPRSCTLKLTERLACPARGGHQVAGVVFGLRTLADTRSQQLPAREATRRY